MLVQLRQLHPLKDNCTPWETTVPPKITLKLIINN